jgi:hypothetical protein
MADDGDGAAATAAATTTPARAASAGEGEEERFEGLDNPSIVVPADAPLLRVPVLSLRPTQLAVGKHSVGLKAAKVASKRAKGEAVLDAWLRRHPIPCVRGPLPPPACDSSPADEQGAPPLYLIDHHHLAAALHSLGVQECYAAVVRDYASAPAPARAAATDPQQQQPPPQRQRAAFWARMREDGCLWPHDAQGQPVAWDDLPARLPRSVAELSDDPYRSLAGLVRRAGGYAKSSRPFAEFIWANHLRGRVDIPKAGAGAANAASSCPAASPPFAALAATGGAGGGGESKASSQQPAVVDVSAFVPLALEHASHRDAEGLPGFAGG